MNANETIKNILKFNETVLENTYNTFNVIFEKNQKFTEETLEKAAFLPEEAKSLTRKYLAAIKKNQENFCEAVLKGNEQFKNYI
jgi:hypothetical protein